MSGRYNVSTIHAQWLVLSQWLHLYHSNSGNNDIARIHLSVSLDVTISIIADTSNLLLNIY